MISKLKELKQIAEETKNLIEELKAKKSYISDEDFEVILSIEKLLNDIMNDPKLNDYSREALKERIFRLESGHIALTTFKNKVERAMNTKENEDLNKEYAILLDDAEKLLSSFPSDKSLYEKLSNEDALEMKSALSICNKLLKDTSLDTSDNKLLESNIKLLRDCYNKINNIREKIMVIKEEKTINDYEIHDIYSSEEKEKENNEERVKLIDEYNELYKSISDIYSKFHENKFDIRDLSEEEQQEYKDITNEINSLTQKHIYVLFDEDLKNLVETLYERKNSLVKIYNKLYALRVSDNENANKLKVKDERKIILKLFKQLESELLSLKKKIAKAQEYENLLTSEELKTYKFNWNNIIVQWNNLKVDECSTESLKYTYKNINDKKEIVVELYNKIIDLKCEEDNKDKKFKVINRQTKNTDEAKKELKVNWKKIKKVALSVVGGTAIVLLVAVTLKSCVKDKKVEKANETSEPTTTKTYRVELEEVPYEEEELTLSASVLDSDEDLRGYAESLKDNNEELSNYTVDEILDAILLANSTKFEDQHIFNNENEIINAATDAGEIITKVGSDNIIIKDNTDDIYLTEDEVNNMITEVNKSMNIRKNKGKNYHIVTLTIDNFKKALTDNGYDMYKILEICINNYSNNNDNAIDYAIIANELITEFTLNFSINDTAPLSAYYIMPAIYNTAGDKLESDSKLKFSTIYGNGNNDNLYGDICVEELVEYNRPGNQDNVFYKSDETFIKDLIVTSNTRTKNN